MLRKLCLTLLAFMLILALAACAAQPAAASPRSNNTSGQGAQLTVNPETRLALGIMTLKGSPQALTAEQAKNLLPLWQAMKALGTSSTTSQVEISALDDQIKGILTSDQNTTIDKLDLSGQNMRNIMTQLGIQFGQAGQGNGGTRTARTPNPNGGGGGGGFPGGGGFQGGGGNFGGGGGAGGTQRTPNPNATRTLRTVNPFIVNAVIRQLSQIAGVPIVTGTPGTGS